MSGLDGKTYSQLQSKRLLKKSSRTRQAAIAIEINPVDSAGSATKKRGIVVRSTSELDEFNRILSNAKLVELARKMDQVNPKQREATSIGVFETTYTLYYFWENASENE